ncbi:enoyl-CoA hydratase/isomerase family protein [Kineosporia rhizophila]|uniref:enoyl-CoA hydratase/isomerase family protein n=1 Tax=Kineosporia TaxID=49184 RepID=UPI001E421FDF|nr:MULTISPECIES: enoyl-CoA hydratase/isomerase family protein [Kineosporia]MCE0539574.1 enoyl-CoA hydratase/isomerase family protein [Kineosporia rhizophila]
MSETTTTPQTTEHVRVTRQGSAGRITLTRPQAINALTHEMIRTIAAALSAWAADESIDCVIIDAEGPRGFCAGGDIKAVSISALSDGGVGARALWWDEYRMNEQLARYPKPVMTLMHGVTFGGGVGLGCHSTPRVVTHDTRMAMPETLIGLVPDVGGLWLLSRDPAGDRGELGTHLALTGLPVGPGDAIHLGLADVQTPFEVFAELAAATSWKAAQDILDTQADTPEPAALAADAEWINRCYGGDDVAAIIERLHNDPHPQARAAAQVLLTRSPTALQITLAAIRRAAGHQDLRETLTQDYQVMSHSLDRDDVREGIRAQVVDKDRNPRWNPAQVQDVDPAVVTHAFTPAPGGDLTFS